MKIFCIRCLRYVLKTSDKFKCGATYNGEMFGPIENVEWHYFSFTPDITEGSLQCPMCDMNFIDTDGSLLTEHGLIPPGMTEIDKTVNYSFLEGGLWVLSIMEKNPGLPIERVETGEIDKKPEWGKSPGETILEVNRTILEKRGTTKKPERSKKKYICKKCGKPMAYGAEHKQKGCPE